MTPEEVAAHFTRPDGAYVFARWDCPIVPVVFGVDDSTLPIFKGAIEAVVTLAGHQMAEADTELGANLMIFCFRDWAELPEVTGLNALVPDLAALCQRLDAAGANQYRLFRFDPQGAIRATFVFLRMDAVLSAIPAEDLALAQMVQVICLWSEAAFATRSPLGKLGEAVILRPDIASLIRAAYDRMLPAQTRDPSHALRVFARLKSQTA
jgi:hypothetical protein